MINPQFIEIARHMKLGCSYHVSDVVPICAARNIKVRDVRYALEQLVKEAFLRKLGPNCYARNDCKMPPSYIEPF